MCIRASKSKVVDAGEPLSFRPRTLAVWYLWILSNQLEEKLGAKIRTFILHSRKGIVSFGILKLTFGGINPFSSIKAALMTDMTPGRKH